LTSIFKLYFRFQHNNTAARVRRINVFFLYIPLKNNIYEAHYCVHSGPQYALKHLRIKCPFLVLILSLKVVENPIKQEESEDTKGVIRCRKSKDRHHNGYKDKQRSTKYYTEN
jgi:hypothetical protein